METKKVEILRKKIVQIGTSKGVVLQAKWLHNNHLNLNEEIAMIQTPNYILIKDCRNPIMNELLNDEVVELYRLERLQDEKIIEAQEWFKKTDKILEAGGGESVGLPIFPKKIDVNEKTAWMLKLTPQERAILRQGWTELLKISEDLENKLGTRK
jgi:hypothetical protein